MPHNLYVSSTGELVLAVGRRMCALDSVDSLPPSYGAPHNIHRYLTL